MPEGIHAQQHPGAAAQERHSKEGDVKIYSKAELVRMLTAYFRDVSWERVGITACIAMGQK